MSTRYLKEWLVLPPALLLIFLFAGCGGANDTYSPTVVGSASFSLTASPSSSTVTAGHSTTYTVTVTALNGFSSAVNLSVNGLPAGATGTFDPAVVTPTANGATSTLTVTTSAGTGNLEGTIRSREEPPSTTLTITGTGGGITKTTTVQLVVQAATAPSFTIQAGATKTIQQGQSAVYNFTVTSVNGFAGTVTFSMLTASLPLGVTAQFAPVSVNLTANGTANASVTLQTSANTPAGTSTPTIVGKSGTLSNQGAETLIIQASGGGGSGLLSNKIVFASSGGIYSMNPDGSNVLHLPNTIDGDVYPDVTKDGKKVLFVRNFNGGTYTMNADGSNLVKVTASGTGEFLPSWSPDGTKIALERTVSQNSAIIVMNADGSNQINLTNNPSIAEEEPKWSPDGTKIIFARDSSDFIFVMNADGSNKVRVGTVSGAREPVFSPDGTKIAFHTLGGNFKIWVMNADGTNVVQLTPQGNPGDDRSACWSPDGTKIVFTSSRDGNSEIYSMNADGSNQIRLTNNSVEDTLPKWR